MISDFEESEYRGPLFNQLEKGSHLLWEPGQVFENKIGIDRASHCLNEYLWQLHSFTSPLSGVILRHRRFPYIWNKQKPKKIMPDFKLNLFIQAKRTNYSSQSNSELLPEINGKYWYFEITPHQQTALENLSIELGNEALVIYASPVFHKQQELYNHTVNQTIVENSTFPQVNKLQNHSKWYYDSAGMDGMANPDFEYIEGGNLFEILTKSRKEIGEFNDIKRFENLIKLSDSILRVVEKEQNDFRATRFAYYNEIIGEYLDSFDLSKENAVKSMMQIETFASLWKLDWLTY